MINPTPLNRRSFRSKPRSYVYFAAFIVVGALLVLPLFGSASAPANRTSIVQKINNSTLSPSPNVLKRIFNFLLPIPQAAPVSITTRAGDCLTPKSVYNLQDTDLTVCATVTGAQATQQIIWSNANFISVQNTTVGTDSSFTFTLGPASSLGDWRVILYDPAGGSVYAVTPFTVIDAANPTADLTISKSAFTDPITAGAQALFGIQVTNYGPSDAVNVQVFDSAPANTTISSFAPISGPTGISCGIVGSDVTCTIPTLARGETAVFGAAYDVLGGTPAGTVIANTATVTSDTSDPRTDNNSSTASAVVAGTTVSVCVLECPADVVVTANATQGGQPGAFVTYAAASIQSGDCDGVSNTPASGSFFTVGTHSIVSTSGTGQTCSFSVTVLDTTPPTISCPAAVTRTAPSGATEYTFDPPDSPGTPTFSASGTATLTFVRSDDTPAVFDDQGVEVTPAVVHSLTDPWPIGTTGIQWKVTDAGGRTATCSQTVTIVEAGAREAVTISCPANVSVEAPSGSCEATVSNLGTPTTNPSDSNVDVVGVRSDGRPLTDPFPAGTTQITWTATDNLGGTSASCTQTVTVTVPNSGDTTPPTFTTVPQNVTTTTSSCSVVLDDELGVAQATDAGTCNGSVTITRTGVPPGNVFPTGTTTVIYTATDAAGNSTSVIQLVTVTESPAIPPTITAPADVVAYTGAGATSCGTVVSDATLGTVIANDNCSLASVTRTGVPAGNAFPVGTTTITYRATDASGNFTEDTQVVTVIDNTPPAISCPASITLEPTCPTGAIATWTPPVGTDNCPGAVTTRTAGGAPGSVFAIGTTTVTYSVSDAHGNGPVSCSFTVTVLTPQAVIQNLQAAVNASSLTGTQKNGLLSKLSAALQGINNNQPNVACPKLSDFINSVQNLVNQGNLSAATGNAWISSANHVRNTIGCTSLPCS